ncbi:MAG: hypothetical protein ACI9PN_002262, partial [Candidatus Azotimanducaceae bacterium]
MPMLELRCKFYDSQRFGGLLGFFRGIL